MPTTLLAAVEAGAFISVWKSLVLLGALLAWARLLTWADKDANASHLPRVPLNMVHLAGLIFALVLFIAIPGFWVALPVLIVAFGAEVGLYLALRSSKVGLGDLGKQFSEISSSLGRKEKEVEAVGAQVVIIGKSGNPLPAPEPEDPMRPTYEAVQKVLSEPFFREAERIDVVPGANGSAVRYQVDGVFYEAAALDADASASAIAYLKAVAGLDVNEKRKPQVGSAKVMLSEKRRHDLRLISSGTTAGESVRIDIDPRNKHALKLEELGLLPDQLRAIERTITEEPGGIVLAAAPRTMGLTSLLYAALRRHDAFLSHILTIERNPESDLEGISQNRLNPGASAAEEVQMVEWVVSQEPDVLMVSQVEDPASARALVSHADSGRRAYLGMRAGGAMEALAQWRRVIGDDEAAMRHLRLIVAARVVRKLCPACKMDYTPDPETLRRLNMPPDRVGTLYQARTQPLRDPRGNPIACTFCHDLYFKGRLGVYELLLIDDELRQVVSGGGSDNQIKMLFKKQRGKYLQEIAVARAIQGETSLQEVARVLKIGAEASPPRAQRSPDA